ncbi:alpha/beta hydrolase [bacterium]|nr:alpha/beta hydrolase [bacterium]
MKSRLCMLVVIALLVIPGSGFAQNPDVAFIHGLDGSSSTWSAVANALNTSLLIDRSTPSYTSYASISSTATSLYPSLQDNSIVIGHSLGGLLSRQMYVTPASHNKVGKLITVGTPHIGAKIANNVDNGLVGDYVNLWLQELTYGPAYAAGSLLFGPDWAYGSYWVIEYVMGNIVDQVGAYIEDQFEDNRPVVGDLHEASQYLYGLNMSESMYGNTMPSARFALIGYETSNSYMSHIRLMESAENNSVENGAWLDDVMDFANYYYYGAVTYWLLSDYYYFAYLDTYNLDYYYYSWWYGLVGNAWYIGYSNLVYYQDMDWSYLNGSLRQDGDDLILYNDDGLLSTYSQGVPAFFDDGNRVYFLQNTNHIEETKNTSTVRTGLTYVLTLPEYGVQRRSHYQEQ